MMQLLVILLTFLLLPSMGWAQATLGPAANPPDAVLYDYRNGVAMQEEFLTGVTSSGTVGALGWFTGGGSGSAQTAQNSEVNYPGITQLSTGATSGIFRYLLYSGNQLGFHQSYTYESLWIARLNTIDVNTTARVGFSSNCTVTTTTGTYFERLDGDTNWFAVANLAGTSTRVDTGIAATADFTKLGITRNAATSAVFYVNDVLKATITTNLPTAGIQPCAQIVNSTTSAKTIDLDYFQVRITGGISR